jgi:4-amino-4-deoxy-L-arabinose transferase-like glycosyltransferase
MSQRHFLGWMVGICLLYSVTRLYGLTTLPLFMDEATHITRSQLVWQGEPFLLLLTGKMLVPYIGAAFYPFEGAVFIGRFASVLVGILGVVGIAGVARRLHSPLAGVIAATLWVFTPQLFLLERMALVDGSLAALAAFTALCSLHVRGVWRIGIAGIGVALTVAAKTTGLVFMVLPAMAWVVSRETLWSAATRRFALKTFGVYVVAGALLSLPTLYILSQSANVLAIGRLSSVESESLTTRLSTNGRLALLTFERYHGSLWVWLLISAALLTILVRPRVGLFLSVMVIVPLAILCATATNLYLRYLVICLPGIIGLSAIGFALVIENLKQFPPLQPITRVVLSGALVMVGLPFMITGYTTPANLPLPRPDRDEYLTGWTSGYGLREAAYYVDKSLPGTPIIGMVGSCDTIRLYVTARTTLSCPKIWREGGLSDGLAQIELQIQRTGSAYVIAEEDGPLELAWLPSPYTVLQTFPRPGGYAAVILIRYDRAVFRLPTSRDVRQASLISRG